MPDDFQALPPGLPAGNGVQPQHPINERFAEVNLRKPSSRVRLIGVTVFGVAAVFAVVALEYTRRRPSPVPVRPIEGTWVATAVTIDGKQFTDDVVANVRVIFNDTRFTLVLPTSTHEGDWGFTNNANEIFFLVSNSSDRRADYRAIHHTDGDTMRLCLTTDNKPRPTDFTSEEGSGRILLVLKRQSSLREDEK